MSAGHGLLLRTCILAAARLLPLRKALKIRERPGMRNCMGKITILLPYQQRDGHRRRNGPIREVLLSHGDDQEHSCSTLPTDAAIELDRRYITAEATTSDSRGKKQGHRPRPKTMIYLLSAPKGVAGPHKGAAENNIGHFKQ